MEKNAGVPENAKTREETAEMALVKFGLPTVLKSETQGTISWGAVVGRSWTPTATVTIMTM